VPRRAGPPAAGTGVDDGLGGVLAWYSIIHLPPEQLPRVFAEFHRVLAPGGHLLVAFKVGDQHARPGWAQERGLAIETWWLPPDRVAALLAGAGFVPEARLEREADHDERQPQAFVLVRKPA
jgi:predicted methyltransferase